MIIAVASQKGGTGKTTTSLSVSAGLAHAGKRVLLVDMDSQANSSKVLLHNYQELRMEETVCRTIMNREPLPIHQSHIRNLDVVPSHILLADADVQLTTAKDHREARLKRELVNVVSNYDHVFIDCPPALSWLTLNAFTATDRVLVLVSPGYFELDSLVQISKVLEEVRNLFNPDIGLMGFLFTMADPTIASKTSLKLLRQTYTSDVLKTVIPKNTVMREAHFSKEDIFSFSPDSPSALAYKKLIKELQL